MLDQYKIKKNTPRHTDSSIVQRQCVITPEVFLYPQTDIETGILSLYFTLTLCFTDHERHQKRDPVRLSDRKQHDHIHERLGAHSHGVCGVQYSGARRERAHCHQRNLGGARCRDCRENGCVFTHAFTHEPNTKFTLHSIAITSTVTLFLNISRRKCTQNG